MSSPNKEGTDPNVLVGDVSVCIVLKCNKQACFPVMLHTDIRPSTFAKPAKVLSFQIAHAKIFWYSIFLVLAGHGNEEEVDSGNFLTCKATAKTKNEHEKQAGELCTRPRTDHGTHF